MTVPPTRSDARIRLMLCSEPGNAGVKRHVCNILEHIDTSRFDVMFAYSLDRADHTYADEIEQFRAKGMRCEAVPMVRQMDVRADVTSFRQLRRLVREFRPDVLHCHSAKAGFLGRMATAGLRTRPRVLYTPNAMPCYISSFYLTLEKIAARWTDHIIAVSPSEREDILAWRIAAESRLAVLSMGVDCSATPLEDLDHCVRQIGACGRICSQKNAKLFFTTLLPLLEEHPNLELVWIGDYSGDEESHWVEKTLSASPHSSRVTITGWVDNAIDRMRELDLFCMFSSYESFGFVTADAMVNGIPVVAIDGTGTRDLIQDGRNGWLTDGTVAATRAAISEAIDNPDLRTNYAATAHRDIIRDHELGQCLSKLFDFYAFEDHKLAEGAS